MKTLKIGSEESDSSQRSEVEPVVLLEEDDFLVCIKPPGLSTTRQEGEPPGSSVAGWLARFHPKCEESSSMSRSSEARYNADCGVCHRLDRETSGLLLVAKNPFFYEHLRKDFHDGKIEKRYLCVVEGKITKPATLNGYLYGRYRRSQKVLVSERKVPRSEHSTLTLAPKEHLTDRDDPKNLSSLLRINLITGFRHQIRAQLAHLGHPLVGDALYGSTLKLENFLSDIAPFQNCSRPFALHAEHMAFYHPRTRKRIEISSPFSFASHEKESRL